MKLRCAVWLEHSGQEHLESNSFPPEPVVSFMTLETSFFKKILQLTLYIASRVSANREDALAIS